jgi:hypothetical protein
MDIPNLRWWGWGTLDQDFPLEGRPAFWPTLSGWLELRDEAIEHEAAQHEMALTLCDVLIRRIHMIYETRGGGLEEARAVAQLMVPRLDWDEVEIERQVAEYTAQVALTHSWREG